MAIFPRCRIASYTRQQGGIRAGVRLCWLFFLLLCVTTASRAEDLVWATGHITDYEGRPLSGAVVVVYDDHNKVVDYARTDRSGDYALAVPKKTLHLETRHGKGFIAEVFGTMTRFVGDTVGFVANPLRAGVHAVTSSQAANFTDPLTKAGISAGGVVADQVLFAVSPKIKKPQEIEERKLPGALLVKVVAPDKSDLVGVTRVYWLQRERFRAGGKREDTVAAWLDPVQLSPVNSERPSRVNAQYLHFTAARLQPSIAEPGQIVQIVATLPLPPEPAANIVVVARNNRTGQKWQLEPQGDGRYVGELEVDRRFPRDDQPISILAYAALEQRPGRREDAEHAIEGAGLWDPKKPYQYDPLLVVSRNRADLMLTVLPPSKKKSSHASR